MENLKIRVNNEVKSKEAQELFFELGFEKKSVSSCYPSWISNFEYLNGRIERYTSEPSESWALKCKEITLPELRNMVVLKRNDPKDATHTDQDNWKWFVSSDGTGYVFACGNSKNLPQWDESSLDVVDLKPIKREVMKEYLFKYNDQYTLVELLKEDAESNPEQYIEVPPPGVNKYNYLYKNGINLAWTEKPTSHYGDLLWQRHKESIIDKLVVGDEKHSHYKKDVSHLSVIDPYRIADLYDLHPCAEHIMKKSLCAGNRGHKDTLRDIQDIIDTAERWKQMIEEDSNEL